MKLQRLGLIGLLAFLALVSGCPFGYVLMLDENSHGRTYVLPAGSTMTVTLRANHTTGYSWDVAQVNSSILKQTPLLFSRSFCPSRLTRS